MGSAYIPKCKLGKFSLQNAIIIFVDSRKFSSTQFSRITVYLSTSSCNERLRSSFIIFPLVRGEEWRSEVTHTHTHTECLLLSPQYTSLSHYTLQPPLHEVCVCMYTDYSVNTAAGSLSTHHTEYTILTVSVISLPFEPLCSSQITPPPSSLNRRDELLRILLSFRAFPKNGWRSAVLSPAYCVMSVWSRARMRRINYQIDKETRPQ